MYLYQILKTAAVIVATAIPASALLSASSEVLGLLGAIVATIGGIEVVYRFHESWLNYRKTSEAPLRKH